MVIILICTSCASVVQKSARNKNNEISVTEKESMESEEDQFKSILDSYYSYYNTDAYRLIKSKALKRFLKHWTDDDIVNPVWNYESFTKYEGEDLYYCTFTADNGKCYYMVLQYEDIDDGGLGKVRYSETPYYYDLRANIDKIKDKLSETELDLSTTVALRAQLSKPKNSGYDEVIIFKDDNGNSYVCYMDTLEISKIQSK